MFRAGAYKYTTHEHGDITVVPKCEKNRLMLGLPDSAGYVSHTDFNVYYNLVWWITGVMWKIHLNPCTFAHLDAKPSCNHQVRHMELGCMSVLSVRTKLGTSMPISQTTAVFWNPIPFRVVKYICLCHSRGWLWSLCLLLY